MPENNNTEKNPVNSENMKESCNASQSGASQGAPASESASRSGCAGNASQSDASHGKQINVFLAKIGCMILITFVCCILFFFILLRFEGFASGWDKVMKAAQPIIIGLILAYLLNPVMKFVEKRVYRWSVKRMKTEEKARSFSRGLGVAGSILFFIAILALLIAAVVPSVIASIVRLVDTVPGSVSDFITMIENGVLGDFEITEVVGTYLTEATEYLQTWIEETILPQTQTYITQITSGVISVVKTLMNFLVGIFVAVYVMITKEKLIGQSKKLVFSIFKPKVSNVIVETVHKADEIFGGFISGKIIDSLIIGVICYIGCVIMRIPDSMLVAVIIGITNIIPVFGPFIGAVPSLLLVVIQSPWHALYLLIFVIVLQQVDGNIIGPKILGNSTGLSAFWVMFAILIAGGMFGFPGMLLGVPVFALIYYLIRKIVNYSLQKRCLPLDTEQYLHAAGVDAEKHSIIYREESAKKKKRK